MREFAKKLGLAVAAGLVLIVALGVLVQVVSPTTSAPEAVATTTTSAAPRTTKAPTTTTTVRSTTTSTSPATSTTLSVEVTEALFVAFMRAASEGRPYNWVDAYDDQFLIDFAYLVCDGWADGLSFEDLTLIHMSVMDEEGWTEPIDMEMFATAMGAGTEAFCPEYGYVITGE